LDRVESSLGSRSSKAPFPPEVRNLRDNSRRTFRKHRIRGLTASPRMKCLSGLRPVWQALALVTLTPLLRTLQRRSERQSRSPLSAVAPVRSARRACVTVSVRVGGEPKKRKAGGPPRPRPPTCAPRLVNQPPARKFRDADWGSARRPPRVPRAPRQQIRSNHCNCSAAAGADCAVELASKLLSPPGLGQARALDHRSRGGDLGLPRCAYRPRRGPVDRNRRPHRSVNLTNRPHQLTGGFGGRAGPV
jgi:hypothetical protein